MFHVGQDDEMRASGKFAGAGEAAGTYIYRRTVRAHGGGHRPDETNADLPRSASNQLSGSTGALHILRAPLLVLLVAPSHGWVEGRTA